jgi:hypothetical protein
MDADKSADRNPKSEIRITDALYLGKMQEFFWIIVESARFSRRIGHAGGLFLAPQKIFFDPHVT